MVPGERALGLVMNQSVRDNILLPNLAALSRLGVLDRRAGDRIVAELMELSTSGRAGRSSRRARSPAATSRR